MALDALVPAYLSTGELCRCYARLFAPKSCPVMRLFSLKLDSVPAGVEPACAFATLAPDSAPIKLCQSFPAAMPTVPTAYGLNKRRRRNRTYLTLTKSRQASRNRTCINWSGWLDLNQRLRFQTENSTRLSYTLKPVKTLNSSTLPHSPQSSHFVPDTAAPTAAGPPA